MRGRREGKLLEVGRGGEGEGRVNERVGEGGGEKGGDRGAGG